MLAIFIRGTVRLLDRVIRAKLRDGKFPDYHRVGRGGEEDAYFYLRKPGYVMAARNHRSPWRRGEIDRIGWDRDVLCFVEVKTRTSHEVKPAETAVDREKRRELAGMARDYLRRVREEIPWRFHVVSIYYETPGQRTSNCLKMRSRYRKIRDSFDY